MLNTNIARRKTLNSIEISIRLISIFKDLVKQVDYVYPTLLFIRKRLAKLSLEPP
jgi:hypothetical protein